MKAYKRDTYDEKAIVSKAVEFHTQQCSNVFSESDFDPLIYFIQNFIDLLASTYVINKLNNAIFIGQRVKDERIFFKRLDKIRSTYPEVKGNTMADDCCELIERLLMSTDKQFENCCRALKPLAEIQYKLITKSG